LQLPAADEPAVGPRGADNVTEAADHLVGA
jgi:hypothetical protein